jgi:N-sulfoglucosamine sulfohydrolase
MKILKALLVLLLCSTACVTAHADGRPNILFCIADDWSYGHAGAYGDKVVRTPTFDRVAREGALFNRAFCSSPSCTPSRGAILTGQAFCRLEEGGNLWSTLPAKFKVYPDLLEAAGYHVGLTGKGWSPGDFRPGGRTRNPAGPNYPNFAAFLKSLPEDKPFCYWFGSQDPHRPYEKGSGARSGLKPEDVRIPAFLPDTLEVRNDIQDYYFEVERFDTQVGEIIKQLEAAGKLDNTLVIITSDNGMPFPRAKTNLYDAGSRMPLAVRWPAKVKDGRVIDDFISFPDFAPTILEAAGVAVPEGTTGRSFLGLLTSDKAGHIDRRRDRAFIGRERHAQAREGNVGYPMRAVRTGQFLYIRNFEVDRWPAGDPEPYADIDDGPTKEWMLANRSDTTVKRLFALGFGKRPAEELYDLTKDPGQLVNVVDRPEYADRKKRLRSDLERWMAEVKDPRARGQGYLFDKYPYIRPAPNRRGRSL